MPPVRQLKVDSSINEFLDRFCKGTSALKLYNWTQNTRLHLTTGHGASPIKEMVDDATAENSLS